MIDEITLQTLSKKLEIDGFTILREYIQIRFLQEFFRHPQIKNTYFKGGTALRLIYESSRFSEDLGFSVGGKKEEIEEILADTTKKMRVEMQNISIRPIKTVQGLSAILSLPVSIASQPMTIKLDFSQRESVLDPIKSPLQVGILPIGGVILVDHLSAKEIVAEKIRAILHRQKGRDLFDLWFMLQKNIPYDREFIQSKMKYNNETYDKNSLLHAINMFDEEVLDQDLRRFLPKSEREIVTQLKRLLLERLKDM